MTSVFAAKQTHNGGFRSDQLTLSFGGVNVRGFLVQNVQFSYSQQVSVLFEIGSENVYYVGGRAQGNATLSRIIGPSALAGQFISLFNDLCAPRDITFQSNSGCKASSGVGTSGGGGAVNYTLASAVLTTVAVSVTAQDVVVNEQLQFIFIDLDSGSAST